MRAHLRKVGSGLTVKDVTAQGNSLAFRHLLCMLYAHFTHIAYGDNITRVNTALEQPQKL